MTSLTKPIVLGLLTATTILQAGDDPKLAAAIDGSHRSEESRHRDQYRHPQKALEFFAIGEDMTVVELWPSKGWYTEILAPYLKENGQLIAAVFNPELNEKWGDWMRKNNQAFHDRFVAKPETYGRIKTVEYPGKGDLAEPGTVDMILDFRNAHNWIANQPEGLVKTMHRLLKPGGIYGIIDHRENADRPYNPKNGYIHEQRIIDLFEANGFKLEARSEINRNPKDTKNHPQGVWTLPPTLALKDKDRDRYLAIGESDRFTLRFIKQ